MHGHWLPDWIEKRPWWVKWSFGLGLGVMLAFLPGLVNANWQLIGAISGAILIVISLTGGTWQAINEWRAKKGKPRLKLEPTYIVILGLVIALTGVIWQWRGGLTIYNSIQTHPLNWPNPYNPKQIINQTFENQEVVLDGFSYIDCTFHNVTFVYNGTTPIQFNNNKVDGIVRYRTDSQPVSGAIAWMKGFNLMKSDVPVRFDAPNNLLTAPAVGTENVPSPALGPYTKSEVEKRINALNELDAAYESAIVTIGRIQGALLNYSRPPQPLPEPLTNPSNQNAAEERIEFINRMLDTRDLQLAPLQDSFTALTKLQQSDPPKDIAYLFMQVAGTGDVLKAWGLYRGSIQQLRGNANYYNILSGNNEYLKVTLKTYMNQIDERKSAIAPAEAQIRKYLQ